MAFQANVIGIPHIPTIAKINSRTGPSTGVAIAFEVPVGTANATVLDVQPDSENNADDSGKLYQWFKLQLPRGVAWIRSDLIEVFGDGTAFGYPVLNRAVVAQTLTRSALPADGEPAADSAVVTNPTVESEVVVVEPSEDVQVPETPPHVTNPVSAPASGPAKAISMGKTGVSFRPGPGTNHNPTISRIGYKETADILGVQQGEDGKDYKWVKLRYNGKEGWSREDFLRYTGSFGSTGVESEDKWTSPAPESWWIRDFDDGNDNRLGYAHHGWDHAGNVGAPILGAPIEGGEVLVKSFCQKCGTAAVSSLDKGFNVSDQRVLRDAGWNFGYGHFIIVRYKPEMLPESTKARLTERGFADAALSVMYAHLHDMLVEAGTTLKANQQIATMGNSGNSTGPHLHLEVRAHTNVNETNWARMKSGLMRPDVLFLR